MTSRGGIIRRTVVASVLLAAVVGTAFGVVLFEIEQMRTAAGLARHSEQVLGAANELERLVIDAETGLRGFALTGDERFLQPLDDARRRLPEKADGLQRLAAEASKEQAARAGQIETASNAFIRDYVDPTLQAVRRDLAALPTLSGLLLPSPQTAATFDEGKRRVDDLRNQFNNFIGVEQDLARTRHERSEAAARRAIVAASAGIVGSGVLVALFAVYLTRVIVAPVRRAAAMAGQLAAGDLSVRMPETGPGEIGGLEHAFNTMAGSLQSSQDELRRLLNELVASRARVVAAADDARRRLERDLHDGIQQRLVSLALDLRGLEATPSDDDDHTERLAEVQRTLAGAIEDLRELSRGIHPAILSRGGLGPALKTLANRSAVPVQLQLDLEGRLPEPVEVAAYYVVSEALTNAAKHAQASAVRIGVHLDDGCVRLSVRDDGIGGADPARGSGLVGLRDRIESIGGTIDITSPPGAGTTYLVNIPV